MFSPVWMAASVALLMFGLFVLSVIFHLKHGTWPGSSKTKSTGTNRRSR